MWILIPSDSSDTFLSDARGGGGDGPGGISGQQFYETCGNTMGKFNNKTEKSLIPFPGVHLTAQVRSPKVMTSLREKVNELQKKQWTCYFLSLAIHKQKTKVS